jgi:hypothetical protein
MSVLRTRWIWRADAQFCCLVLFPMLAPPDISLFHWHPSTCFHLVLLGFCPSELGHFVARSNFRTRRTFEHQYLGYHPGIRRSVYRNGFPGFYSSYGCSGIVPYCAAGLGAGLLFQLVPLPRGSMRVRITAWCVGLLGWFSGTVLSILVANS